MSSGSKARKTKQKLQIFLGKYFRLVIFLVVILVFFGSWFFLKPKYQQIIAFSESQRRQVMSDFESKKIYLDKLVSTINAYNQIDSRDTERVEAIVPPPAIKETFFTYMDNLMRQNGFLLTSLSVQPVVEETGTKKKSSKSKVEDEASANPLPAEIGVIKMNMSVAGVDYEGVKRLLKTMENNLRLMDINELSFSIENETANLVFNTYYYKDDSAQK